MKSIYGCCGSGDFPAKWLFILPALCFVLSACPSKSNNNGDIDAAVIDGAAIDAETTDGEVEVDASPCTYDIPLGDPCGQDCDCVQDLVCRGLPGETVCAVPCLSFDDCRDVDLGCASKVCDMNFGACRCYCQVGECGTEQCVMGFCVGCSGDDDCASHTCSPTPGLDQPMCRLDTETCVCGGECGDTVCDEIEELLMSCPEDCTGPCTEGAVLAHWCPDGIPVAWCTCTGGTWVCSDPTPQCTGDTDCQKMGGYCVAAAGDCSMGQVAGDPYGCTTPGTLCCLPDCVTAGMSYPPGMGMCCPGLVPLDSLMLMESFDPNVEGITCEYSCWQKICAPCGDGTCQYHLGENYCNCPEDCPHPPYDLVCVGTASHCGQPYCRQEGSNCHQEMPACNQNQCSYDVQDLAGHLCNPVTAACESI